MRLIIISFILIIFYSCKPELPPSHLEEIINKAGENSIELEKAYRYFQKSKDSLKQKAFYFLLENMQSHYLFDSRINCYFDKYYEIFSKQTRDQKDNTIDSLIKEGVVADQYFEKIYDINTITAAYLIENINLAFEQWDNSGWKDIYPFNIFCEYVLPYRVDDQVSLENIRPILINDYQYIIDTLGSKANIIAVYSALYRKIIGDYYNTVKNFLPMPMGINDSHKAQVGLCSDACNYFVAVARSFGIPTFTDYTPAWGNFRMGHTWNSLILPDSSLVYHIRLEEHPKYYKGMIHAMRDFDYNTHELIFSVDEIEENIVLKDIINNGIFEVREVNTSFIPENFMIFKQKKISKVFRNMYSIQKSSLCYIEKDEKYIPGFFRNYYIKDVTKDYFEGINFSVKPDSVTNDKYVFLCIFQKNGFVPVDWSKIDKVNNIANFQNVGSEILYFAMYYRLGKYIPATNPFILKDNGDIEYIIPDINKIENITLFRKFPIRLRTIYYANFMLGGKIQASNDPGFKNAKTLHEITQTPLSWVNVNINDNEGFQYIRYINEQNTGDIGELEVYSAISGKEIKQNGKIISSKNKFTNSPESAFDGNLTTFSRGGVKSDWIGLDLCKKLRISKIRFYPRYDSNEILPGQYYELMYWNNGWKSLGIKNAINSYLVFENVPSNSLFWLINHSGGNEERPFTYKKGMQVWW